MSRTFAGWLGFAALAGVWASAAAVAAAPARPDDGGMAAVRAKVQPSIVYLMSWTEGTKDRAEIGGYSTGFVVADRQGKKWIMTAGHLLEPTKSDGGVLGRDRKVVSVDYRPQGRGGSRASREAILDAEHDLAALRPAPDDPLDVPALELATVDPTIDKDWLYAFGSANGLPAQPGHALYTADPINVKQWADSQLRPVTAFRPLTGDVLLLRHHIDSALGWSGCPIVTADGKVVGVQSMTLPNTPSECFAIHHDHLRGFDWTRKPLEMAAINLAKSDIGQIATRTAAPQLPFKAQLVPPPAAGGEQGAVTVKFGGVDVEAPFVHHGYLDERDAETVVQEYVQDKPWYADGKLGPMPMVRLQEMLDRSPVARISNPVLGFEMLVPKGYRYSAQGTANPDGLLVTFRPPAERAVAETYRAPLSVWARVEPAAYAKARSDFVTKQRAGRFEEQEAKMQDPAFLNGFRQGWVNGVVGGSAITLFTWFDLNIRYLGGDGTTWIGEPSAPRFQAGPVIGGPAWWRSNYWAAEGQLSHNVRTGNRDPLVFIVHYQYAKEDMAAFLDPKGKPDATLREYAIMASSVSFK